MPGSYKVVVNYESHSDTTLIDVVADPRFDVSDEIDLHTYEFKKALDIEVSELARIMKQIDQRKKIVEKLKTQLEKQDFDTKLIKVLHKQEAKLEDLRAKGQTPRPKRQLGAWRSFDNTPYSKLRELLMAARARTGPISNQQRKALEELNLMILDFGKIVTKYIENDWVSFKNKISKSKLKLVDTQD